MDTSSTAGNHPARGRLVGGGLVAAALFAAYLAGRAGERPPAPMPVEAPAPARAASPPSPPPRLAGAPAAGQATSGESRGARRVPRPDGGIIEPVEEPGPPAELLRLAEEASPAATRALFDRLGTCAREGPYAVAASADLWRALFRAAGADAPAFAVEALERWDLPLASSVRGAVIAALGVVPDAFSDGAVLDALARSMQEPANVWHAGSAALEAGGDAALDFLAARLVDGPDTGRAGALKVLFARRLVDRRGVALLERLQEHAANGDAYATATWLAALEGGAAGLDAGPRREAADALARTVGRALPALLAEAAGTPSDDPDDPTLHARHAAASIVRSLGAVGELLATPALRGGLADAMERYPDTHGLDAALAAVERGLGAGDERR